MIAEDQSDSIAFLTAPATHGLEPAAVERIDTHTAVIVLAGHRAFKLKRAVRYPDLDFGTLERRLAFCRREVLINRRTAPIMYHGVRPILRTAAGLEMGTLDDCRRTADSDHTGADVVAALDIPPDATVADWVIDMRRFDQATLFDRMADRQALTPDLMRRLSDRIHRFHIRARLRQGRPGSDTGASMMQAIVDGNIRRLGDRAGRFDADTLTRFRTASEAALAASRDQLNARCRDGFVRQCHGDLHLRNICLAPDEADGLPVPTLFDAIEFNDRFVDIDVLYDLAFLLMDLEHRGRRDLANLVLNRYIAISRRMDAHIVALPTLALFLAQRAAIRAHAGQDAADNQPDTVDGTAAAAAGRAGARQYLDLALGFLAPRRPVLVAIGGLRGAGKSTLAQHLAPSVGVSPGALLLRSDVIRKRLRGVMPETRLGADVYTPAVTDEVFRLMAERATLALKAGWPVIVDAVFGRPAQRRQIEQVAMACGVAFRGIWLTTPPELADRRIAARRADPSDATVARRSRQQDPGDIAWLPLDATGPVEALADRVLQALADGRCDAGGRAA